MHQAGIITSSPAILNFITGGDAFFTIKNPVSGNRFTYHVEAPKNKDGKFTKETTGLLFVSLLVGSDNYTNYKYFGTLRLNRQTNKWTFIHGGEKAKIGALLPSVRIFNTVFNNYVSVNRSLELAETRVQFWHEGKCCRCGRKLTVPESIASGVGPECAKIRAHAHAHN